MLAMAMMREACLETLATLTWATGAMRIRARSAMCKLKKGLKQKGDGPCRVKR